MKYILENYHRNLPNEELIYDLQITAKKIKKNTVTMSEYERYGKYHPRTLQRRFGSWFKVLEVAGLEDIIPVIKSYDIIGYGQSPFKPQGIKCV